MVCETIYLLGWTEGYGISENTLVVDPLRPSENITHCSTSIVLTWISVGYKTALVILGGGLAFLCRNLPAAFNESKYIAICMYNFMMIGIVLVPILSSNSIDDNTKEYIRSFCILALNISIHSVLLLPKLLNPTGRGLLTDHATRTENQSVFGSVNGSGYSKKSSERKTLGHTSNGNSKVSNVSIGNDTVENETQEMTGSRNNKNSV